MDDLSGSTILVVDDNPSNLQMISKLLTYAGFIVKLAAGGMEALTSVKSEKPDLVLLDLVMPGMDGIEVCQKIKNDPETKQIPVIFCTGNEELGKIEQCFDAGGDDYTTKPIESHIVLNRIETHLELAALRKRYREESR
jgi:CheY-like chemotaxis protein